MGARVDKMEKKRTVVVVLVMVVVEAEARQSRSCALLDLCGSFPTISSSRLCKIVSKFKAMPKRLKQTKQLIHGTAGESNVDLKQNCVHRTEYSSTHAHVQAAQRAIEGSSRDK